MRKIAIISGKGGVGKTTLTANIGTVLTMRYVNCVAIDANIGAPNLGLHLNMVKTPFDITDVMSGKVKFDDPALIDQNGLKILPASVELSEKRKRATLQKLPKVFSKIHGDIVLVDCPPGVNAETQAILKSCDEILLVTTPDLPSLTAGCRLIEQARKINRKVTGIVLNRVQGKPYEVSQFQVSQMCGANIIASIPEDLNVPQSISARVPLVKFRPTSPAAESFQALASALLGQPYAIKQPSIFQKLIQFLQDLVGW